MILIGQKFFPPALHFNVKKLKVTQVLYHMKVLLFNRNSFLKEKKLIVKTLFTKPLLA